MMLTGDILGQGVADSASGLQVSYTIIAPQKTTANLAVLGKASARWKATHERFKTMADARQIDRAVAERAEFADQVLAIAAENLRIGVCCSIFCQGYDGKILGTMVYMFIQDGREGLINLLAVDPEHVAGSPGRGQLRGIGTAMVAVASRKFLERGVQQVNLHPLDSQAALFWTKRGFGACGAGGLMCVRGRQAIEGLIGQCRVGERPDDGEIVICGTRAATEAMRVTSRR